MKKKSRLAIVLVYALLLQMAVPVNGADLLIDNSANKSTIKAGAAALLDNGSDILVKDTKDDILTQDKSKAKTTDDLLLKSSDSKSSDTDDLLKDSKSTKTTKDSKGDKQ